MISKKSRYRDLLEPNQFEFEFRDDGKHLYRTGPEYLYTVTHDYKFIFRPEEEIVMEEEDDDEKVENYAMITFENVKFDALVYSPYLIINKTEQTLYFGEKDSKEDNLLCIHPHKIEYFNPAKAKKKSFAIKLDGFDWSQKFDISTVGIAGVCSLERNKNEEIKDEFIKNYDSKLIDFGVVIESLSDPYNMSKTVKFVPRYILVNMSNHPIIVMQEGKN